MISSGLSVWARVSRTEPEFLAQCRTVDNIQTTIQLLRRVLIDVLISNIRTAVSLADFSTGRAAQSYATLVMI